MGSNVRIVGSQVDIDAQSFIILLHDYPLADRAQFMSQVLAAFCSNCWRPAVAGRRCECLDLFLKAAQAKPPEPLETVDFVQCDGCDRRVLWAGHERTKTLAPLVLPLEGEKPNIAIKLFGGYPDSSAESGETRVWQYRILTKKDPELREDESRQMFLNHFANCKRASMFRKDKI